MKPLTETVEGEPVAKAKVGFNRKPILSVRRGRRVLTMGSGKKIIVAWGRDKKGTPRWAWNVKKALEALDTIAKAGMIPRGSRGAMRSLRLAPGARGQRARNYLMSRTPGGAAPHRSVKWRSARGGTRGYTRTGVYKALETLGETIEKARGMIPRGGSKRLYGRMLDRAGDAYKRVLNGASPSHGMADLRRARRAANYLHLRTKGVRKDRE